MLELLLLVATIVLAGLAITGYDQYLATKVRSRIIKEKLRYEGSGGSLSEFDSMARVRIKKVKATKIGSYLVITLVVSDSGKGGEEVEVSDPTLLLPLLADSEDGKEVLLNKE